MAKFDNLLRAVLQLKAPVRLTFRSLDPGIRSVILYWWEITYYGGNELIVYEREARLRPFLDEDNQLLWDMSGNVYRFDFLSSTQHLFAKWEKLFQKIVYLPPGIWKIVVPYWI
jgi:hypothetical protein